MSSSESIIMLEFNTGLLVLKPFENGETWDCGGVSKWNCHLMLSEGLMQLITYVNTNVKTIKLILIIEVQFVLLYKIWVWILKVLNTKGIKW